MAASTRHTELRRKTSATHCLGVVCELGFARTCCHEFLGTSLGNHPTVPDGQVSVVLDSFIRKAHVPGLHGQPGYVGVELIWS